MAWSSARCHSHFGTGIRHTGFSAPQRSPVYAGSRLRRFGIMEPSDQNSGSSWVKLAVSSFRLVSSGSPSRLTVPFTGSFPSLPRFSSEWGSSTPSHLHPRTSSPPTDPSLLRFSPVIVSSGAASDQRSRCLPRRCTTNWGPWGRPHWSRVWRLCSHLFRKLDPHNPEVPDESADESQP